MAGHVVVLAEVEAALRGVDGLAEIVCAAEPHDRWGDQVVAVVRPGWGVRGAPDERILLARLRAAARATLPPPARPARYLVVDDLPRTPGGKVARGAAEDLARPPAAGGGDTAGMTTDGVVHLSRTFPADLDQVWRALTDPAELAAWFWPADYGTTAEADARVGGRYRIAAAGRQLAVEGEYLEVAPPRRLVASWRWDGDDVRSVVHVDLIGGEHGSGLTLTHEGLPPRRRAAARAGLVGQPRPARRPPGLSGWTRAPRSSSRPAARRWRAPAAASPRSTRQGWPRRCWQPSRPTAGASCCRTQPEGPAPVGDVVLGNCCGPGGDVARIAALAAGLGSGVPGSTVDRQCGSGLEAVRLAAALVRSGEVEAALAGGTESATHARDGGARAAFAPPGWPDPEMGVAADELAAKTGVSRERQDAYAARSHRLAVAAAAQGCYADELVTVAGCSADDRPRPRLTVDVLARMPAAFVPGGTVTAGNACGINDGAAAVAVVTEQARARAAVPGLRILATAAVGVDPELPGLGPVPAVREVLRRAALPLDAVDVVEITEAFAAQLLACTDLLGLDPLGPDDRRVCPDGGAIALGHPWGASGALLVVRLFSRLVTRGAGRYGVAACAVGGGQGVAVLVEAVRASGGVVDA